MALLMRKLVQRCSLLRSSQPLQQRFSSSVLQSLSVPSQLLIDGKFVQAEHDQSIQVLSPATGKPVGSIADASIADVNKAVEAARKCFDDRNGEWRRTSVQQRSQILHTMADMIEKDVQRFAMVESYDCGKPIAESEGDIGFCIDIIRYYADIAEKNLATEILSIPDTDYKAKITKEPFGVIGCVTPWNYPLLQSINKVAPAIAAGCTVVLKPSPLASLTSLMLGQVANDAGLPAGVLNVITGGPPDGNIAPSQALVEHPGLDKLSFTGSSATGEALLHASAQKLRPTSLELGGKGAIVVFDDVNLDTAVDWIMVGIFLCTGQVCSATSRLLVHEDVAAPLLEKLKQRTESITLGEPQSHATTMGPLISQSQQEKVMALIQSGIEDGCNVLTGGPTQPTPGGDLNSGYYVQPTIFTDVTETARVWKEEIFGPVLAVRTFKTEDEAIQSANNSPFGLAHAVLSADEERCSRVANALQAGVVYENCSQVGFVNTPFGGCKQSGFGREWGEVGLEEYVHHKTINSAQSTSISWGMYSA